MIKVSKYSSFCFDEDNFKFDKQIKYIQPFRSTLVLRECAVGIIHSSTSDVKCSVAPLGSYNSTLFELQSELYEFEEQSDIAINIDDFLSIPNANIRTFSISEANTWSLSPCTRYSLVVWVKNTGGSYTIANIANFVCFDYANDKDKSDYCGSDILELRYSCPKGSELHFLKDNEFAFFPSNPSRTVLTSFVGGFNKRENGYDTDVETFRDVNNTLHNLSGFNSQKDLLLMGDSMGVPNDMGKKLSLIMSCEKIWAWNREYDNSGNVGIGIPIVLADKSTMERMRLKDNYPFYVFSCSVERRDTRLYNQITKLPTYGAYNNDYNDDYN